MMLRVSPSQERTVREKRMERGIETMTIIVDRQLPRKRRIMAAVSAAAMTASRMTPATAALTKTDWSARA
jgi:hypothetical protein